MNDELDDILAAFSDAVPPEEAEAAAERIAGPPQQTRRSHGLMWALLCAAALLLAMWPATESVPSSPEPVPEWVLSPVSTPAPLELPPSSPVAIPAPTPKPRVAVAALKAPRVVVPAPPTPPPSLPLQTRRGLTVSSGSQGTVVGATAHLQSGVVSYVHTPDIDPGVRTVRLTELDVRCDPVGTAFVVGSRGGMAVVVVTDGVVHIKRRGRILRSLKPGQGIVLAGDRTSMRHKPLEGSLTPLLADLDLDETQTSIARALVADVRARAGG